MDKTKTIVFASSQSHFSYYMIRLEKVRKFFTYVRLKLTLTLVFILFLPRLLMVLLLLAQHRPHPVAQNTYTPL